MRSTLKGILKYLIYMFIAGWMFLLGIVVGRGTSPVKFDTQKFQDRLESIVQAQGKQKGRTTKKMDLEFFGALDHPIPTEGAFSSQQTKEIIPGKESHIPVIEGSLPFKTSLKASTVKNQDVQKPEPKKPEIKKPETKEPGLKAQELKTSEAKASGTQKTEDKTPLAPEPASGKAGQYTIQIAAYKDFKDAVTQMAQLEKKGFAAYRVKTIINGVTWYRIRTGAFSDYDQAKLFNERLKKARINAMIIKKDNP
ncbi:MAG: SPOR domain-containing protein [Pseudomonadota bacterium]